MIYLDNAASTAPSSFILDRQKELLSQYFANPDATHEAGYQSLIAVNRAESSVLKSVNALDLASVVWTGTATEALNLAIAGFCSQFSSGEIVTTAIEHKAMLEPAQRSNLQHLVLPLDSDGIIDLEKVKTVLTPETRLIAIHHVNNETGVIQPVAELAKLRDQLCPKAIILLDAAQSLGKLPINWKSQKIDMLVGTAHKIHGINGTAILVVRNGLNLKAQTVGGGQQNNRRSGTLNVPGIVAFSEALKFAVEEQKEVSERIGALNNYARIRLAETYKGKIRFHSKSELSDPHILSFAIAGYQGAILMRGLG
ncbi:MAG: aminotransferase class V-fold PLP-dependent enzyme, partial [Lentisphaeria bacterium]|nr:aminotransferase class V-fold PLP-dependent enzyme [Lentisphaeria bacterium]